MLPQVGEVRYLWALFEALRWRLKQEIDRRAGAAGPVCCEEGAELEGEAVNLLVDLHSLSHM